MTAETWRPVVGFEGRYEVSDQGRVRSRLRSRPLVLRPIRNGSGYLTVHLRQDGRAHSLMVHAIVATAFHGPRPDGLQIRHLDGDDTNNCASNLRYGTAAENAQDAIAHGTHHHASKTHCARGHLLEETARVNADGFRVCRVCIRENSRNYKARRRATDNAPELELTR